MGCQTVLRLGAAGLVASAESQHGNKDPHICVSRVRSTKSVYTKMVPIYNTHVAVAKPSLCQALSPWQTVTRVLTGPRHLLLSGLLTPQNAFTMVHIHSFANMHPYTVGKDYEIVYSDTDATSLSRRSILASYTRSCRHRTG